MSAFRNDDGLLRQGDEAVLAERRRLGLDGLVGGLEAVIIGLEPDRLGEAAAEMLGRTSCVPAGAFAEAGERCCVLDSPNGVRFLLRTRSGVNPFREHNLGPKSVHLPNTRLETFVFRCQDLDRYVTAQAKRGVRFLTPEPVDTDAFRFIQTVPSRYTGNSIGLIQWKGAPGRFRHSGCQDLDLGLDKPDKPHLRKIFELDHAATRVHA